MNKSYEFHLPQYEIPRLSSHLPMLYSTLAQKSEIVASSNNSWDSNSAIFLSKCVLKQDKLNIQVLCLISGS